MLKKKKMISVLVTTMILVTTFGFSSYGASVSKTLQAFYGTSKIIIDGEDVTTTIEPFIVNGTTYIPLRAVANAFNKRVDWNPLTSTANITEDLTQVDAHYQTEILKRDIQIMNLESRIMELEKKLEENKELTLSDLEKKLNKDFDEYRDIEFKITLSGTTRKVKVRIDVDLDDYKREWDSLTTSRKTSYLQDIVDEILDAYDDASVEGYIRDTDAKKTILEFTTTKKGVVELESSTVDISDLEEELDNEYHNYFSNIDLSIELDGDEDNIIFYVYINYNKYRSAWDKISDSSVKSLMSRIYDDIEDEFEDAYIEGIIYDTYNREDLAGYDRTSTGKENFKRY